MVENLLAKIIFVAVFGVSLGITIVGLDWLRHKFPDPDDDEQ